MDTIDALSRSRCRQRRLNKEVTFVYSAPSRVRPGALPLPVLGADLH